MLKSFITLLLLLSMPGFILGQSYLYLQKKGKLPDQRWKQGERIELLFYNGEEEVWKRGYFEGGDSLGLNLGTRYYLYKDIHGVRYAYGLMPIFGKASLYGAALFSGIFTANGIINNDSPILRPEHLYVGGTLLTLGLISKPFWYKKRLMADGYSFKLIKADSLD